MNNTHLLPHSLMGTVTRTRLLMAAFCLSLCGLGLTAGASTLAQAANVMSVIVDNRDSGFAAGDFISSDYVAAYKGHTAYTSASAVTVPAKWTLPTQGNATYDVYATWGFMKGVRRTKAATYVVKVGGVAQGEKTVDQNKPPAGLNLSKWNWELLATVTVSNGQEITVELGTAGDAITLADAVMIRKTSTITVPPVEPGSCGNGVTDAGEQCDDGNPSPGDGCSASCRLCPVPSCAAPPAGCTYVQDGTYTQQGCFANPCGVLKCDGMPTDMNTCLANPSYYWDQQSSTCVTQRTACTDPDNGANAGVVGHTFGFRTQNAGGADARIRTGGKDFCVNDTTVREHSCTDTYFIAVQNVTCEGGTKCVDGACVKTTVPPEDPCGNGVFDQGEQCDLGNPGADTPIPGRPGYICKATCTVEVPKIFCRHNPTGNNLQCSSNFRKEDCAAENGTAYPTMQECEYALVACRNGFDDDKDGTVDMADKGCSTESDMNEEGPVDFSIKAQYESVTGTPGGTVLIGETLAANGPDRVTQPITVEFTTPSGITPDIAQFPHCVKTNIGDTTRTTCTLSVADLRAANPHSIAFNYAIHPNAQPGTYEFDVRLASTPQGDPNPQDNEATTKIIVGSAVILGDANKDGTLNTGDATRILQLAAAGGTPTADDLARSDVNKKGNITKADAYLVMGVLSGQLDSLPALFGDVTGDMNVTATDASRVSQMITALARRDDGSFTASMFNVLAQLRAQDITARMRFLADVNRDGVINQLDVDLIMQAATGIHFELPVETSATACTDTDGGNAPATLGTVTVTRNGVATTQADACENGNVREYFCENNDIASQTAICQHGCENGVCKPGPVVVTQCSSPAANGSAMQNQTLSVDVDQNGTVDIRDARLTIAAYNFSTANGTIPTSVDLGGMIGDAPIGVLTSNQRIPVNVPFELSFCNL